MPDAPTVRLVITSEQGGSEERVVGLPVTFGRDPERADVVLADRMVSRLHARLEADGDRVVLLDLDSANGTWIDDDRVERRPLDPDDVVTLGAHAVRCALVRPEAPVEPPPPGPTRATPAFGAAGGVVLGPEGLRFLPLADLYALWAAADQRLGEITEELARGGAAAEVAVRLDAHQRCTAALDALVDTELDTLAPPTISLCAPDVGVRQFRARVAAIRALPAHGAARPSRDGLADGVVDALLEEDRRLVDAFDAALDDGLTAFAELGAATTRDGSARLMGALRDILVGLGESDTRLAERRGETAPATR